MVSNDRVEGFPGQTSKIILRVIGSDIAIPYTQVLISQQQSSGMLVFLVFIGTNKQKTGRFT